MLPDRPKVAADGQMKGLLKKQRTTKLGIVCLAAEMTARC